MQENFEFPSLLGTLRGHLTHAQGETRGVLVCLHGQPGGDLAGNTGIFDELAALARPLDYATLQFSFCGASPSEGTPEQISFESQLADFTAVLSFARARSLGPIHIVGESAGATIAALRWDQSVASYILLWPAFDLAETDLKPFLEPAKRELARREGRLEEGGVILGPEFLEEIASTDFSKCFDLPNVDVFIAHGQADPEVPYKQSLQALQSAKRRLVFVSHPEADHGFKDRKAREYLKAYLREWLSSG
jgi:uncharacterized protein